jgi:hypothetical protein
LRSVCVAGAKAGGRLGHCMGVWLLSLWLRKMLYGDMDG